MSQKGIGNLLAGSPDLCGACAVLKAVSRQLRLRSGAGGVCVAELALPLYHSEPQILQHCSAASCSAPSMPRPSIAQGADAKRWLPCRYDFSSKHLASDKEVQLEHVLDKLRRECKIKGIMVSWAR